MANVKISDLPAASAAAAANGFEIDEAGTSKKVTGTQVAAYVESTLGTIVTQDSDAVSITGGTIAGLSSLDVAGALTVDNTVTVDATTPYIDLKTGSTLRTRLYGDASQTILESTSSSLIFKDSTGEVFRTSSGHVSIPSDSAKLKLGVGSDLEIYHDGNDSYIKDVGTGLLFIRGSTGVRVQGANGENGVTLNENGSVDLYHDNALKLSTSATGATVTGTVAATAFTGDGSALTGISSGDTASHQRVVLSSQTITVGTGGTLHALVIGGGGSGERNTTGSEWISPKSSGGGAGGAAYKAYTVSAGDSISCTVGAGGNPAGSSISNGGSTSVTISSVTVTATGGVKGTEGSSQQTGGAGGAGSGGDTNWTGGAGGDTDSGGSYAGCGGGGAVYFGIAGHSPDGGTSNTSKNTSVEVVSGGGETPRLPVPFLPVGDKPAAKLDAADFHWAFAGGVGNALDNTSSSTARPDTENIIGYGCGSGGVSGRADTSSDGTVVYNDYWGGGQGLIILVMEYTV